MGSFQSKSNLTRVSSSSAAFGRLRFDSPKTTTPRRTRQLQQRLQNQQQQQHHQNGLSPKFQGGLLKGRSSSFSEIPTHTEVTPLILPPSHQTDIRQLAATPSTVEEIASPPLAVWIGPALCCALAYALYNIFIKKGSASINPVLGGVILQLVAAVLGMVLLWVLVMKEGEENVIVYDGDGIKWAILAGVSVGAAEIISFFVSSLGVQAMQSIPIIIGGSVMFGTILGALVLGEELSLRGWVGVILISLGISLVGMDDSGTGH